MNERNMTFAIIKCRPFSVLLPDMLDKITNSHGFEILRLRVIDMTVRQAIQLYDEHLNQPYAANLIQSVVSGPTALMMLSHPKADAWHPTWRLWRQSMGDRKQSSAGTFPSTIRGFYYGRLTQVNDADTAVHGSDSADAVVRETDIFFPDMVPYLAACDYPPRVIIDEAHKVEEPASLPPDLGL